MTHPGVHSALRVPADLQVVGFVRCAFAALLEREGWPVDGAGRVLLASTEALTNAIEHGSPRGASVEVELSVSLDRADLRVADEGRPGVPVPAWPRVPPPVTSTRGRGLMIISRLADGCHLRPGLRGGTEMSVVFLRNSLIERAEELGAVQAV